MIDWKARLRNPAFIIGTAALVLGFLTTVGLKIDNVYIMNIIRGLCTILGFIGVMTDTSTPGITDKIEG